MLRDIRELAGDPEAYAAELNRRWGGLLSYRYLGRSYSSMDIGATDTVPVRHDMARRIDAGFLAGLVVEHRLSIDDAHDVARLLAHDLAHDAYRVDDAVAVLDRVRSSSGGSASDTFDG